MRIVRYILCITALASCNTEIQQKSGLQWFNTANFVDGLVANMAKRNPQVSKSFTLNNNLETKLYSKTDSLFWINELTKLREIDLNAPKLRDVLTLKSGINDAKSNLLIDVYSLAENEDIPFKKLSIYYLKEISEVRQIIMEFKADNPIAHSTSKVNLWLSRYNDNLFIDSLIITGEDHVLMQATREYKSITRTLL